MIFAEITFCSSINLEQPVIVLVLPFFRYQLSCGMRYLILSVPMSLLVLKENPGPHFVQRLFFLVNISLNITYLVGICSNSNRWPYRRSQVSVNLPLLCRWKAASWLGSGEFPFHVTIGPSWISAHLGVLKRGAWQHLYVTQQQGRASCGNRPSRDLWRAHREQVVGRNGWALTQSAKLPATPCRQAPVVSCVTTVARYRALH